jgi:hypothetical protein
MKESICQRLHAEALARATLVRELARRVTERHRLAAGGGGRREGR